MIFNASDKYFKHKLRDLFEKKAWEVGIFHRILKNGYFFFLENFI